jgi:hypothetical protein
MLGSLVFSKDIGFSNNLDPTLRIPSPDLSRHPMYLPSSTLELPQNALAQSWPRNEVALSEIAASIQRTQRPMMSRNELIQQQLLLLLRNQSSAPVMNPVFQGGLLRVDVAYLTQLLQQRNAAVLASMESTNRLLQQQVLQRAILSLSQASEVVLPAAIDTALYSSPRRRETSSDTILSSNTIPLSLPVGLGRPMDSHKLTEYQGFLRQQIQVFSASFEDTDTHMRGRNKPVTLGQVGIRCRHCARVPVRFRHRGSTYFPSTKYGIYQAAQNMATAHIPVCSEMPESVAEELLRLRETSTAGAGRRYWVDSATQLGLIDTEDAGIRFFRDLGGLSLAPATAAGFPG